MIRKLLFYLVKSSRQSSRFTHLMYVDYLVVYCTASPQEARAVADCMKMYCELTGQEVNWHKTVVHFSQNVGRQLRKELSDVLQVQECNHKGSYLRHPFCNFKYKKEVYKSVVERLSNKLIGWKQKCLSMAGRTILIKSIALAIPSHIMQSFLIPKGVLSKMDAMIRDFFWGFKTAQQHHHLYLKSWKDICLPKRVGGLGIRRLWDMNLALLMKLAWRIISADNKPCIQLIRAKYLKGRKLLDLQSFHSPASWICRGITQCIPFVRTCTCFQLAENSTLRTKEDPWLYEAENFSVPNYLAIPPQFQQVKDLMYADGKSWNEDLVTNLFPPRIRDLILDTPIFELEHDKPIWNPSLSGKFTVKAAYHWIIQGRMDTQNTGGEMNWKHIWSAGIHNRHKFLLWRVAHNLLPTLNKLSRFMLIPNSNCLLCGQHLETLAHIFITCSVSKLI